ncbi:acyl-CoA dehydrogenase family protein [Micromonospora sp. CPCC 205561]|uniref:acyl-CoA dehydrogenase family protein n=1 Tax=Micromonospora sp. CPCC 205561 TaxID=3122407 RepID=UPI002FF18DAA
MSRPSFGNELLRGRLRIDLLDPLPDAGIDPAGEAFLARLRAFCVDKVDGRLIEREDRIPDEVVDGLRDLGAFAIKLPTEYGGLGLSGVCYHRALMIVSTAHSSLGELLGAHQAIGLIQPLRLFGTDAQKRELLPRCVREISAFALTEPDIGNDPFRMRTTATPTDDGGYRLDGVKLWTTNGTIADLIVVMALVPPSERGPGGMSAFVVEAAAQGVTVEHRSSFLGLRGLENGVVRLHGVVVPASRRIGPEGQGLQVALAAQDTGRLSMPAVCAAAAKWSLKIAREWSGVRVQWDRPIGEHEAVAGKIAFIAATAFALEAMVEVTGRHADAGLLDTHTEGELAKLFGSEQAWRIADELMQIRGGRGYETAESAAARGERGVPVEQLFRDLRIGRIFDGSSEALRVFVGTDALADEAPPVGRSTPFAPPPGFGALAGHLTYVDATSAELARHLADARERWGEAVAERQLFLGRVVDVAAELYAMTAACVYARALGGSAVELADAFCHQSRQRVAELRRRLWANTDADDAALAGRVLGGNFTWLEEGVLDASVEGPWIAEPAPGPATRPNLHRTYGGG